MSGRKQHYVPRFLQAGFNSRAFAVDEAPRAWLYRKDVMPVEAALRDIGHDEWFYTFRRQGVTVECADGAITTAETDWMAELVDGLRRDQSLDLCIRRERIAQLLSHLVLRSRAIWEFVQSPAQPLFEKLRAAAREPLWLQNTLTRLLTSNRPLIEAALATMNPGIDVASTVDAEVAAFAEGKTAPAIESAATMMSLPWEEFARRAVKLLRIRTLLDALRDPNLLTAFEGCTFKVETYFDGCMVLGDTSVVFHREGDAGYTPFHGQRATFDYAYLPLTPTKVLIASRGGTPHSWQAMRDASVACSHTYFIAATRNDELSALASSLGHSVPFVSKEQIDSMHAEAMDLAVALDAADPELLSVFETLFSNWTKASPHNP